MIFRLIYLLSIKLVLSFYFILCSLGPLVYRFTMCKIIFESYSVACSLHPATLFSELACFQGIINFRNACSWRIYKLIAQTIKLFYRIYWANCVFEWYPTVSLDILPHFLYFVGRIHVQCFAFECCVVLFSVLLVATRHRPSSTIEIRSRPFVNCPIMASCVHLYWLLCYDCKHGLRL